MVGRHDRLEHRRISKELNAGIPKRMALVLYSQSQFLRDSIHVDVTAQYLLANQLELLHVEPIRGCQQTLSIILLITGNY